MRKTRYFYRGRTLALLEHCIEFLFDAPRDLTAPRRSVCEEVGDDGRARIGHIGVGDLVQSFHGFQVGLCAVIDGLPILADFLGDGVKGANVGSCFCFHNVIIIA